MPRYNSMTGKKAQDERELDRAIEKTFPASDPVAPKHITGTEPVGSEPGRKAPKILKEDIERAATEICARCDGNGTIALSGKNAATMQCPDCLGLGRVVVASDPGPH